MENYYKIGGSLRANHPTYVIRQADNILLNYLKQGEYCYVLNSRQMGKSSLRVSTARKLSNQDIKCVNLDLTLLGSCVQPQQWYKSIGEYLLNNLNLDLGIDFQDWWSRYIGITEIQIIYQLLELILEKIQPQKLVIFIDEVDSLFKVNFKDDFFAFIRACYNQRAENPLFEHLCFCLLGVAAPNDLITDPTKTPFNIGRSVELTGFTFSEAQTALLPGLATQFEQPKILLQQILDWTGGQPFLTQKLCSLVVEFAGDSTPDVAAIVKNYILQNWENQDHPEHLRTICDRVVSDPDRLITLISLYQQILQNGFIEFDNSPEQFALRLTGLVVKKQSQLVIYNPIYQTIFNLDWSNSYLEKQRPYNYAFKAWLSSQKDSSFLLAGEELTHAESWSKDKQLTNLDYQFLAASQREQDQKENQILAKANKRARNIIKTTLTAALGIILATTAYSYYQIQRTRQINELEKSGNRIDEQFTVSQLGSLIKAIETGEKLKSLVNENQSLSDYPTSSPISALFNTLRQIQIKNELSLQNYSSEKEMIAFSSDGEAIAATNSTVNKNKGTIQLWNPNTGALISTINPLEYPGFIGQQPNPKSLKFSPDNRFLALLTAEGSVTVWKKDGTQISHFQILDQKDIQNNVRIDTLEFSPDGQSLAIPSSDGMLQMWSIQGKQLSLLKPEDPKKLLRTYSISFSPNGQWIASGTADGKLTIWKRSGQLHKTLSVSNGEIYQVLFSPRGDFLVVGDHLGKISFWDLNGQILNRSSIDRSISNFQLSSDAKQLVIKDVKGIVQIWSLGITSHPVVKRPVINPIKIANLPSNQDIYTLSFSRNTQIIRGASRYGRIYTWPLSPTPSSSIPTTAIAFNADNQLLISSKPDGTITLKKQGKKVNLFKHYRDIKSIFFRPKTSNFVTVSDAGDFEEWSEQGELVSRLFEYPSEVRDVAFSAADNLIMIATNGEVISMNLTGQQQQNIIPNKYKVTHLAVHPKGRFIAFVENEKSIHFWDREKQKDNQYESSLKPITDIDYNQDGSLLAASYVDGTIQIWRDNGTLLLTSKGQGQGIYSLDFKSGNNRLMIVNENGRISSFTLTVDALVQQGCHWLQDYLLSHPTEKQTQSICSEKK